MNVMTLVQWLLIVVAQWIYFVDANWITGNLCWSMPCMNGGSCFGSAYTYLCVCPVNYSGALCEKRLGICQENPCGNRGLCVETGLTSFECRCYFDYMGPLCEEHVPKNDASVWSSLLPAHTRVLFDILQEAYRTKAHGRSSNSFNSVQNDFSSSPTTTLAPEILTTSPIDTTKVEHVIPANAIQLENIFPETNIAFESNTSTQISPITTEQNDYIDETSFSLDTTTDTLQTSTIENIITVSTEQYQTTDFNTTETQQFDDTTELDNTTTTTTTTVSTEWTSDYFENSTDSLTTEMLYNNLTETMIYTTDNEDIIDSTSLEIMNSTDDYQYMSSEQMVTSTSNPTEQIFTTENVFETTDISQNVQSQLLLKLCQQLIAHILPNISSSAAIETALNLVSSTASSDQNSTEALVSWLKEKLSTSVSSSSSPPPTTTTTTTTTTTEATTTTKISTTTAFQSSLPSLLIKQKKLSLVPLQRVDMDDALYQMSDNIDSEN